MAKFKEPLGDAIHIIEIENLDDSKIIGVHDVDVLTFTDSVHGVDRDIERALKKVEGSNITAIKKARKQRRRPLGQ